MAGVPQVELGDSQETPILEGKRLGGQVHEHPPFAGHRIRPDVSLVGLLDNDRSDDRLGPREPALHSSAQCRNLAVLPGEDRTMYLRTGIAVVFPHLTRTSAGIGECGPLTEALSLRCQSLAIAHRPVALTGAGLVLERLLAGSLRVAPGS